MMNLVVELLITMTFSAFFSGMEIAFVSSNKLRFEMDKSNSITSRILSVLEESGGKIKWLEENAECLLVPGGVEGISVIESSNGQDPSGELVLRFVASIKVNLKFLL